MWPFTRNENRQSHWEKAYRRLLPEKMGWYQDRPEQSLRLIQQTDLDPTATIIDVGGGTSRLALALLDAGYSKSTVLDISHDALKKAQEQMGAKKGNIEWIVADLLSCDDMGLFDLWHDRAVFHFLTEKKEQEKYLATLERSLAPGGYVVISTFAPDGPTRCSGLPVLRYCAETLQHRFGKRYSLITSTPERHTTPEGGVQPFVYCLFQRI